jgi:hypothetical protein
MGDSLRSSVLGRGVSRKIGNFGNSGNQSSPAQVSASAAGSRNGRRRHGIGNTARGNRESWRSGSGTDSRTSGTDSQWIPKVLVIDFGPDLPEFPKFPKFPKSQTHPPSESRAPPQQPPLTSRRTIPIPTN